MLLYYEELLFLVRMLSLEAFLDVPVVFWRSMGLIGSLIPHYRSKALLGLLSVLLLLDILPLLKFNLVIISSLLLIRLLTKLLSIDLDLETNLIVEA